MPLERPPVPREAPPDAVGSIPLRVVEVDLVRLVSSTLEPLEHEARALDVTLEVASPADTVWIAVDPEKVAWIVATLAGNALRYVRRGTRRLPGGAIVVRIGRDVATGAASLAVEDDGPGIPPETLASLFARQVGAPHARGLALTLVQDIVAAHGGTLTVESSTERDSHGTAVRMTFPGSRGASTA